MNVSRRDFVAATAAASAAATASVLAATAVAAQDAKARANAKGATDAGAAASARKPPNFLLLMSDQHRGDTMGCMGHPVVKTPHMDRLAREGVLFRNCSSNAPVCVPARVCVLTGLYPHNSGVFGNQSHIVETLWTFPRALQRAGYRTAIVGKTHFGANVKASSFYDPALIEETQRLGFDDVLSTNGKETAGTGSRECMYRRYLQEKGLLDKFTADFKQRKASQPHYYSEPSVLSVEDYHDTFIGRTAAQWIRDYQGDKPFMLWANWGGPHAPWDAPGQYATMYDPAQMPPPIEDPMENAPKIMQTKAARWIKEMPKEAHGRVRANYYGMVSCVDASVGEIMAALEAKGLRENTIVIYFADHGEMLYDHGLAGKSVMYDGALRVPLILSCPRRFSGGKTIDAPVMLLDIVPTILGHAGLLADHDCQGHSLTQVANGKSDKVHDVVYAELGSMKMALTSEYKYVYDPSWDRAQLFSVADDPKELANLSGDPKHAEAERRMRDLLLEWQTREHQHFNSGVPPGARRAKPAAAKGERKV